MRKFHLYLWLIALVGMITSCSQDTADMLPTNESNRVSFTASLPADFAKPGTRANEVPAFPTGHKLRCILEVWSTAETPALIVRQETTPATGSADITFEFELADASNYKALLWADYIGENAAETEVTTPNTYTHYADKYYTTNNANGLKDVKVTGFTYEPEPRDAFFAAEDFTKGAAALTNLTATLTRPFTKLTIAEKNTTNFGYCEKMVTKYKVPNKLDVSTGAVSGTTSWQGDYSSGDGDFGKPITIKGTACKILFTDYILADADGTMGEIELTFTPTAASGKKLKTITIPAGVPAKRNYRINAAGSLIAAEDEPSPTTKMTVDIKSDWNPTDEEVDVDPKVDWYFNNDGTWSETKDDTKAIGRIFYVGQHTNANNTPDDKSSYYADKFKDKAIRGYVVPLVDKLDKTTTCKFSEETEAPTVLLESAQGYLGYYNTQQLKTAASGSFSTTYPAASAADSYTAVTAPDNTSGWYLPGTNELKAIFKAFPDEFNVTTYSGDNWDVLSSTRSGTYISSVYRYNGGSDIQTGSNAPKDAIGYVIPVLTFFDK